MKNSFFSRKDRHRQARDAKVGQLREKLFQQKDTGYTEALEKMNSHTVNILEVFCGYLAGLRIDFKDFFRWLANLLHKNPRALERKLEFILVNRIQNLDELYKILQSCE